MKKVKLSSLPVGSKFVLDNEIMIITRRVGNGDYSAVETMYPHIEHLRRVFFGYESVQLVENL